MSKVLLIEDEERFAGMVRLCLQARLISVEWSANGTDGLHLLRSEAFDAAIIDWNLPDIEGVEIVRRYRDGAGRTPILMLTGRSQLREKIAGFDCGADDYLTKPFQPEELYVRVRSLMKRPKDIQTSELRIGDLKLIPEQGRVFVRDENIKLTKKEFDILELLLRNKGVTVATDAIVNRAWSADAVVSVETLRTHITNLKGKLKDSASSTGWDIKNIYGGGYVLDDA
jgi:DNA-binding response OmpR family regulator